MVRIFLVEKIKKNQKVGFFEASNYYRDAYVYFLNLIFDFFLQFFRRKKKWKNKSGQKKSKHTRKDKINKQTKLRKIEKNQKQTKNKPKTKPNEALQSGIRPD